MAVKSGTGEKSGVPIPIIVVAVVALLAFVVWMGYRALGPQPEPQNELTQAHDKWMDDMAKYSGGDVNKLKPEDMAKLQGQTRGHAAEALKGWIKNH
jgi:hypothetical protein